MKLKLLLIGWMVLLLPACSLPPVAGTAVCIDWVDFIVWNDIHYSGSYDEGNTLQEQDIEAKVGQVTFKVADHVKDPNYKIKNGDAAYLEKGTELYRIKGYRPEFRIAVKAGGEWRIYEADTSPKAKKGEDLVDIAGKVAYIGINSETDGKTELAAIKDKEKVESMVKMIMEAKVDQTSREHDGARYFISFHLEDGTQVTRCFWSNSGELSRGMLLPEEFGAEVKKALERDRPDLERRGMENTEAREADEMLERIIQALIREDADLLMPYVDPYDRQKEHLVKAIRYYKEFFGGSEISGYEFLGKQEESAFAQYNYRMFNADGKSKEIRITDRNQAFLVGFDNFIRYAEAAEAKMAGMVQGLKDRDVKQLSLLIWNSMEPIKDDNNIGIYPVAKSEEVLKSFEQSFDLDTLDFQFTGNTTEENGNGFLIFKLTGKKNGQVQEHQTVITFGDGQVGIADDWIPPMYSGEVQNYDIYNLYTKEVIRQE